MANDWVRVNREFPCKVCEGTTWCTRSTDGGAVHCMRIESSRPARGNSGGWIHRIDAHEVAPVFVPRRNSTPVFTIDWSKRARQLFIAPTATTVRARLADELGVSVQSLVLLGVGHGEDAGGGFSSWPERNAAGRTVGIVRRYTNGTKKHMAGGTAGLYLSANALDGPILCPEGGSDTAALLTMGLAAIGRPSNVGGVSVLAERLKGETRPVVVLGEHDEKVGRRGTVAQCQANCSGCSWCWPGRYGAKLTAERLTAELGRTVFWRMVPDGAKDSRAWVQANGHDGLMFMDGLRRREVAA